MTEQSPEEICKKMFGIDYRKLVAANPSWKDSFYENLDQTTVPQELSAEQSSYCVKAWGEVLRSAFPWEKTLSVLDPILGCLKMNKHSIAIHRLEKDLVYLTAMTINKRFQIFISFPISPVSLGILTVAYFAHIADSFSKQNFIIWIRPKDNGKIIRLRTTTAFNLVDSWRTRIDMSKIISCLPSYKISEPSSGNKMRVLMVRSLSEAVDLLKTSKNCSLVVIDDPSGRTYPSPSAYGSQAFGLASLCRQKRIPMVGIVPPWTLQDIEYHETNNSQGILLLPIDFFALRSYPAERIFFAKNSENYHPIEESYFLLERKRLSLKETQVIIKTFNFDTEDE